MYLYLAYQIKAVSSKKAHLLLLASAFPQRLNADGSRLRSVVIGKALTVTPAGSTFQLSRYASRRISGLMVYGIRNMLHGGEKQLHPSSPDTRLGKGRLGLQIFYGMIENLERSAIGIFLTDCCWEN